MSGARRRFRAPSLAALSIAAAVALAAAPARAQDAAAQIVELDRQALVAYDNLDFARARSLLEKAVALAERSDLAEEAVAARTHLFLGMVLLDGFSLRAEAVEHFQAALRIEPAIAPPPGLFNPETAALFRVTKKGAPEAREEAPTPDTGAPPRRARKGPAARSPAASAGRARRPEEADVDQAAEPRATPAPASIRSFIGALAIGAGGGTVTGQLDMHGVSPSTAPGGFAWSETAHAVLAVGYFWSPSWLLSVEGRLQWVNGATPHCQSATTCPSSADSAFAALAKATRFFTDGSVQPFLTAGLGGGAIRQRVKLNGLPDCGRNGDQQCYDTVAGGPVFVAGGGGLAYQVGSLLLQAGVTANVGFPSFMLNVDATLGIGLLL